MNKLKKKRKNMMKQYIEDKKLMRKYPFLRPTISEFSGRLLTKAQRKESAPLIKYEIPDGWWKCFGIQLCDEIQTELNKTPFWNRWFNIQQVKEKYGELRIYCSGTEKINKIIDKYSVISRSVCYKCGKLDSRKTKNGWIIPICRECYSRYYSGDYEFETDDYDLQDGMTPNSYTIRKWNPNIEDWTTDEISISYTVKKLRNK